MGFENGRTDTGAKGVRRAMSRERQRAKERVEKENRERERQPENLVDAIRKIGTLLNARHLLGQDAERYAREIVVKPEVYTPIVGIEVVREVRKAVEKFSTSASAVVNENELPKVQNGSVDSL